MSGGYNRNQIITAESFNYLRRMIMDIYDRGYGDRGYGQCQRSSTTGPTIVPPPTIVYRQNNTLDSIVFYVAAGDSQEVLHSWSSSNATSVTIYYKFECGTSATTTPTDWTVLRTTGPSDSWSTTQSSSNVDELIDGTWAYRIVATGPGGTTTVTFRQTWRRPLFLGPSLSYDQNNTQNSIVYMVDDDADQIVTHKCQSNANDIVVEYRFECGTSSLQSPTQWTQLRSGSSNFTWSETHTASQVNQYIGGTWMFRITATGSNGSSVVTFRQTWRRSDSSDPECCPEGLSTFQPITIHPTECGATASSSSGTITRTVPSPSIIYKQNNTLHGISYLVPAGQGQYIKHLYTTNNADTVTIDYKFECGTPIQRTPVNWSLVKTGGPAEEWLHVNTPSTVDGWIDGTYMFRITATGPGGTSVVKFRQTWRRPPSSGPELTYKQNNTLNSVTYYVPVGQGQTINHEWSSAGAISVTVEYKFECGTPIDQTPVDWTLWTTGSANNNFSVHNAAASVDQWINGTYMFRITAVNASGSSSSVTFRQSWRRPSSTLPECAPDGNSRFIPTTSTVVECAPAQISTFQPSGSPGGGTTGGGSPASYTGANASLAETHPYTNWPHCTSNVSSTNIVSWNEWFAIRSALAICKLHQGGSNIDTPPAEAFSPGQQIQAHASNNSSGNFVSSIQNVDTNRHDYRSESVSIFGPATYSSRDTPWQRQIKHCFTVTFATADEARYFFNSGGEIRLISERTGDNDSPQDRFWSAFLRKIGMIRFTWNKTEPAADRPQIGSYTHIGYYNLSETLQRIYWADGGDVDVGETTEMIFREGNRVVVADADATSRADGQVNLNTQALVEVGSTTTDLKVAVCEDPTLQEACSRASETIEVPAASGSDSGQIDAGFESQLDSWTDVYMYETGDEHEMRILRNAYGMNTFEIWAKTDNAGPGLNGDRGRVLTFEVILNDVHSNGPYYDYVTGLIESSVYYQKATRYLGIVDPIFSNTCTFANTEGTPTLPGITFTVSVNTYNETSTAEGNWNDLWTYKWSITNADTFRAFMEVIDGSCALGNIGGAHYGASEIPWYEINAPVGQYQNVTGLREQAGCTYRITIEAIDSFSGLYSTASVVVKYSVCLCPPGFIPYTRSLCEQTYRANALPNWFYTGLIPVTHSSWHTNLRDLGVWISNDMTNALRIENQWIQVTLNVDISIAGTYRFEAGADTIGKFYVDNYLAIQTFSPSQWFIQNLSLTPGESSIVIRVFNIPGTCPGADWYGNPSGFACKLIDPNGDTVMTTREPGSYRLVHFQCPNDGLPSDIVTPNDAPDYRCVVNVTNTNWHLETQEFAVWVSEDGINPYQIIDEEIRLIAHISIGSPGTYTFELGGESSVSAHINSEYTIHCDDPRNWISVPIDLDTGQYTIEFIARNDTFGDNTWTSNPAGIAWKLVDPVNGVLYHSRMPGIMKIRIECGLDSDYTADYTGRHCVKYAPNSTVFSSLIPVRHSTWPGELNGTAVWVSTDGILPYFIASKLVIFRIYFNVPTSGTYRIHAGGDYKWKIVVNGVAIYDETYTGWNPTGPNGQMVFMPVGMTTMEIHVQNNSNGFNSFRLNPIGIGFKVFNPDGTLFFTSRETHRYIVDTASSNVEYIGEQLTGKCRKRTFSNCVDSISCLRYVDDADNINYGWTLENVQWDIAEPVSADPYGVWVKNDGTNITAEPFNRLIELKYQVTLPVLETYHITAHGKDICEIWIDNQLILSFTEADGVQTISRSFISGSHLITIKCQNNGTDPDYGTNPAFVSVVMKRDDGSTIWHTRTPGTFKRPKILHFKGSEAQPEWVSGNFFKTTNGWTNFDEDVYLSLNYDVWYAVTTGLTIDNRTPDFASGAEHFIKHGAWEGTLFTSRCISSDSTSAPPACSRYIDGTENRYYGYSLVETTTERNDQLIGVMVTTYDQSTNPDISSRKKYYKLLRGGMDALPCDVTDKTFYTTLGWVQWKTEDYLAVNIDVVQAIEDNKWLDGSDAPDDITAETHFITRALDPNQEWERCVGGPLSAAPTGCWAYLDSPLNHANGWTFGGPNGQHLLLNGNPPTVSQVIGRIFWTTMGWIRFDPTQYKTDNSDLHLLNLEEAAQHFIDLGAYQGTICPRRCIVTSDRPIGDCNEYVDGPENQMNGYRLTDVGMMSSRFGTNSKQLQYNDGTGWRRATHDEVEQQYFYSSNGWVKFDSSRYVYDNDDVFDDPSSAIDHFIDFGAFEGSSSLFSRCISVRCSVPWSSLTGTGTTPCSNPDPGEWSPLPDASEQELASCSQYIDHNLNKNNGWYINNFILYKCEPPCTEADAVANGREYAALRIDGASLYTTTGWITFDASKYVLQNPDVNAVVTTQKYFTGQPLEEASNTVSKFFLSAGAWESSFGRCVEHTNRTQYVLGQYIDGDENKSIGFTLCDNTDVSHPYTTYGKHLCYCSDAFSKTGCRPATSADVVGRKFWTSRGMWEPFNEEEYTRLNKDVRYMVNSQMWYDSRRVPTWPSRQYQAVDHFIDFGAWEGQYGRNFNGPDYNII